MPTIFQVGINIAGGFIILSLAFFIIYLSLIVKSKIDKIMERKKRKKARLIDRNKLLL